MKNNAKTILAVTGIGLVVVFSVCLLAAQRQYQKSFAFIGVDHPVEMWDDGKDRWVYYSIGSQDVPAIAAKARAELVPLGFREDTSKKPWFRFLKGDTEVVVCSHDEVEKDGSKLEFSRWSKSVPRPTTKWAVAHVKNGPGSGGSLAAFAALKVIHGW